MIPVRQPNPFADVEAEELGRLPYGHRAGGFHPEPASGLSPDGRSSHGAGDAT